MLDYSVHCVVHRGYCWDPYDVKELKYSKKITYPLLKIFKKSDINEDNTININNSKLDYYEKLEQIICCDKCLNTWNLIEAIVIKKVERVILDD